MSDRIGWFRPILADATGPEGFEPGDLVDVEFSPWPVGDGWQPMYRTPQLTDFIDALHDAIGLCGHCGKRICPQRKTRSQLPARIDTKLMLDIFNASLERARG